MVLLWSAFDQDLAPQLRLGMGIASSHVPAPSHSSILGACSRKKSLKKVTKPPHIWTFSSGASVMHLVRWLCTPGLRIWHLPPPGAGMPPTPDPQSM